MQKTKIEWADYVWNPIKGLCPVGCWYCYAKAIYNRFEWMLEDTGDNGYLAEWELEQPIKRKKPTKIFVCSTYELFHSPNKSARDEIFKIIEKCPQHTFQILTKFPENIDRDMPENVWLGVTITRPSEITRWTNLYFRQRANLKFVSFEPLLEQLDNYPSGPDWIIIGRLTGHGHKHDPNISWIKDIVKDCSNQGVKVFLKNNLKDIWGEPLIQEFPRED